MAYIYRHIRLDTMTPFYIGLGSDNNYKRANSKCMRNTHWSGIVKKHGYRVDIMIDDITLEDASLKEKEMIQLYGRIDKKTGILCNMTDGGEGIVGYRHTEESKLKISESGKGRKHSLESLEKRKNTPSYYRHSPETLKIMSDKNRGKKHTEEHKRKISESNKGKIYSEETKRKISASKKGKRIGVKHTEETKIKMGISKLKENLSPETRAKLSASAKNKKHSQESIAKMRIAQIKPPLSEETKKKLSNVHKNLSKEKRDNQNRGRHSFHVSAFCVKTGGKIGDYTSLCSCSKQLNIATSSIRRYLEGISKNPLRYTFIIIKKT